MTLAKITVNAKTQQIKESCAFTLHTDDIPNIEGCGERKHKAGKQNGGRGEFKLTVLAIVKVCRSELDEEKDGKD